MHKSSKEISSWLHSPQRPRIIAVDFDGTMVEEGAGPDSSKLSLKPGAKESFFWMKSKGLFLILWTCRSNQMLMDAEKFLKDNGIEFDAINDNHPTLPFNTSRKIFADFYIDDRAGFSCWDEVRNYIQMNLLSSPIDDEKIITLVVETLK